MHTYETKKIEEYRAMLNGNPVIVEVVLKWYADEYSDQGDDIGTFSNTYDDYAVDRRWEMLGMDIPEAEEYLDDDGEWVTEDEPEAPYRVDRNEYVYFSPGISYSEGNNLDEYRTYALEAYARMEALIRGDFVYIGIMAEADVLLYEHAYRRLLCEVSSSGIWGVESDIGKDIIERDYEKEQLEDLNEQLRKLGIVDREEE